MGTYQHHGHCQMQIPGFSAGNNKMPSCKRCWILQDGQAGSGCSSCIPKSAWQAQNSRSKARAWLFGCAGSRGQQLSLLRRAGGDCLCVPWPVLVTLYISTGLPSAQRLMACPELYRGGGAACRAGEAMEHEGWQTAGSQYSHGTFWGSG